MKSAALEVAAPGTGGSESEQKNITVNAICPGYLDTEMTQSSIANIAEKTGLSSEQAAEKLHSFSPQKRLFTADEVAQAALYLASPAASGINGQALSIDGEKPGNTSVTSCQYFPSTPRVLLGPVPRLPVAVQARYRQEI